MNNSFIAQNFRAFSEIKIPTLKQVNLFLGKNSVGKTALLEALYIYLHNNKADAIYQLLIQKEEHLSDKEDLASVISHLFHGHRLPQLPQKGILLSSLKDNKIIKSKSVAITTAIDEDNNRDEVLMIVQDEKEQGYPLTMDFRGFYRRSRMFENYDNTDNLKFVSSVGIYNDTAQLWDNIVFESKQDEVIKALKIVESEISDVTFINPIHRGERVAIARINGEKVPFKSMGDGINRIFHIALSMVNAQDGYLFIDEFENGLHYLVQKRVWEVIFILAKQLNVQVFATTHSSDCIKAFGTQWQKDSNNATLHRLDFTNAKHTVETYTYDELDAAVQTSTEVR